MHLDNFIWRAPVPEQAHAGGPESSPKEAGNLIISSSASL